MHSGNHQGVSESSRDVRDTTKVTQEEAWSVIHSTTTRCHTHLPGGPQRCELVLQPVHLLLEGQLRDGRQFLVVDAGAASRGLDGVLRRADEPQLVVAAWW